MNTRASVESSPSRVKRQRQSYSCTECTRRKLRCSKKIPCLACTERGIAHECRRRSETIRKETRRKSSPLKPADPPRRRGASANTTSGPTAITPQRLINSEPQRSAVDSVNQDAAVMLEFLALSRQHVLEAAQNDRPQTPELHSRTHELLFTGAQVKELMEYHQECISWVHNVVHMPDFLEQCEERLCSRKTSLEEGWLSLYYAILAVRTQT